MPLTLATASEDWNQPSSAMQSPVEPIHLENAKHMAKTLTALIGKFIQAGEIHLANDDVSNGCFIAAWKKLFERCLNEFGANYMGGEEDADNRDTGDVELGTTSLRNATVQ